MISYLHYNFHDIDPYLDDIYNTFISNVTDVYMLSDDIQINSTIRRFIKSAVYEILSTRSTTYMDSTKVNVIAVCNSRWDETQRLYIDSKKFKSIVLSEIDKMKRSFPILIKKCNCEYCNIHKFLISEDGNRIRFELKQDYEKLKSSMSFKKLKSNMVDYGLKHVYNEFLTNAELKKLLIL